MNIFTITTSSTLERPPWGVVVLIEANHNRPEGLSIYKELNLGKTVAEHINLLIDFVEEVGFEGVHGLWVNDLRSKVIRGTGKKTRGHSKLSILCITS